MELAKINTDGLIDIRYCDAEMHARLDELRADGFLDFESRKKPECDHGYIAIDSFIITDGKIIQSWDVHIDLRLIHRQINDLKEQLSATDYKVVKCMELIMASEPLPYDINLLHINRQEIRSKINYLETKI